MSAEKPLALELADLYTAETWPGGLSLNQWAFTAATELRRLHAENEALREALKDAQLGSRANFSSMQQQAAIKSDLMRAIRQAQQSPQWPHTSILIRDQLESALMQAGEKT